MQKLLIKLKTKASTIKKRKKVDWGWHACRVDVFSRAPLWLLSFFFLATCIACIWKPFFFLWVLSIQQKFRFEISAILRVQWNGTFRLHRPGPKPTRAWLLFLQAGYKRAVLGTTFQSWSRIFRSDQTEMVRSI